MWLDAGAWCEEDNLIQHGTIFSLSSSQDELCEAHAVGSGLGLVLHGLRMLLYGSNMFDHLNSF